MSPATGWPSRHQDWSLSAVPMIGCAGSSSVRRARRSWNVPWVEPPGWPHQRAGALMRLPILFDHTAAENPCRACSGWLIPARAPARTLHLRPIAKHRIPGGPTMSCAVRHASTYSAHRSVGWSATPQASCVPLETGWVTCGGGGTDGPMTSGQYAHSSRGALKPMWIRPFEGAPRAISRPVRIGETRQDLPDGYCCRSVVSETPTSPPGEAMVT